MSESLSKNVVGVDISKEWLDAYIHPTGKSMRIDNTTCGIAKLITTLSCYKIDQVVCESSGGYECLLLAQLRNAQYKTWRVDPKRIKSFRESEGIRAKTDKLDAKVIALFAMHKHQAYVPYNLTKKEFQLQAYIRRRDDLKHMCTMEKLRLDNPQQYCKISIKNHISYLEDQISEISKEIEKKINTNEGWRKKRDILLSMPGVGERVASSMIADVPELGKIENKQAASLLGVAPFTQESGKRTGIAYLAGGRSGPRNTLYMGALSATRCNPIIKVFYDRLILSGKKPKVAIVACMNKMVRTLNAMLRDEVEWSAEKL